MARVYVSAGEPSGDLHASRLVSALLAREPSLEIFGMGGPRMREAGCEIVQPIDQLALMGFAEVFWGLPRIWRAFGRLIGLIRERRPDVAVLVDYPGFHLRLARRLKKEGVPVVVYIAPQVWAWKPGRARAVAGLARKVLVIFEFERPLFERAGADVEFVGHPLLEELDLDSARPGARGALSLDADCPLLAVMPGARGQVVKRLLPVFMRAARELRSLVPDLAVAVGTPDGSPLPGSTDRVHELAPPVNSHDLLRDATAGLFASGTVTLEAALFGVPGVVGYKMGLLNYAIGRSVLRVPHISLANIILGEQVYPELIQRRLTPAAAAAEVLRLLKEPERRARASEMLRRVRERLGTPGASARAAEAVLGLIG